MLPVSRAARGSSVRPNSDICDATNFLRRTSLTKKSKSRARGVSVHVLCPAGEYVSSDREKRLLCMSCFVYLHLCSLFM
ncbi:hypothetical protein M431DRAFT_224366 [Trichoderma harzianum CBS 226.95]|uniref:Uncharacterized protein n=1 Tax=Trichoderma harzianum CBS 226.95 TaxID=983964 RepID=A0A2T4A3L6_TRIHA|nr:hypothetical protein M431DRAFT_224366 [Trichoderma harzianum CBS 226.95]PTB51646.1 hypothetical protein M431DRAFT_224366 [Trichoderma harzianum CBS 226.95]